MSSQGNPSAPEELAIIESKVGRLSPPSESTPFGKYFNRIGTVPLDPTVAENTTLIRDLFGEEYPEGAVYHAINAPDVVPREITTSWCVFPMGSTRPVHVTMSVRTPNLNTRGTSRSKFCSADRLKLLNACYGGADNVRYNSQQKALITSLRIPGADGHGLAVCIPLGHERLSAIVSGLPLKRFVFERNMQPEPYLFEVTLTHNDPSRAGGKTKSGIPLTSNLFYALFWRDQRFMSLLQDFVPMRPRTGRAGRAGRAGANGATGATERTGATAGNQETGQPQAVQEYRPGMGKGLMTAHHLQQNLVADARAKLDDMLQSCMSDETSSTDDAKVAMAILCTLMRDPCSSTTTPTQQDNAGGDSSMTVADFTDIVDKLGHATSIPTHPPCYMVWTVFQHYMQERHDSFVSFGNINERLMTVLNDDTDTMIPRMSNN